VTRGFEQRQLGLLFSRTSASIQSFPLTMYYHDYEGLYGARGRAVLPSSLWGGMAEKRHGGGGVAWSFGAVSL
jgi:hypothetical protein